MKTNERIEANEKRWQKEDKARRNILYKEKFLQCVLCLKLVGKEGVKIVHTVCTNLKPSKHSKSFIRKRLDACPFCMPGRLDVYKTLKPYQLPNVIKVCSSGKIKN